MPSRRTRDEDRDDSGLYDHLPDSSRQPDVPQGEVTEHIWKSQIYEGTTNMQLQTIAKSLTRGERP